MMVKMVKNIRYFMGCFRGCPTKDGSLHYCKRHMAGLKIPMFNGEYTSSKSSFSIAMLVYQRLHFENGLGFKTQP